MGSRRQRHTLLEVSVGLTRCLWRLWRTASATSWRSVHLMLERSLLWVAAQHGLRRHAIHRVEPLLRGCLLSSCLVVFEAINAFLV